MLYINFAKNQCIVYLNKCILNFQKQMKSKRRNEFLYMVYMLMITSYDPYISELQWQYFPQQDL